MKQYFRRAVCVGNVTNKPLSGKRTRMRKLKFGFFSCGFSNENVLGMEIIMRKSSRKILTAAFAVVAAVVSVPLSGQATGNVILAEEPLAGITLSLDHHCDTVIQTAQEDAEQARKEEEQGQIVVSGGLKETVSAKKEKTKTPDTDRMKLHYKNLGIADVDTYLNVRAHSRESSDVVGKMTKNDGCDILSMKKGWAKIQSGKVKGYVKAKYLLRGDAAQKKALKVARLKAVVETETLNVRYLPSTDAKIYDQISEDEDYTVEKENLSEGFIKEYIAKHCNRRDTQGIDRDAMYDDLENWVMLSIDSEKVFVSKDFISIKYKLNHAVTIKEEKEEPSSKSSSIVDYAMQFLGNRYVWGGTSLTNGTDCSGFTMGIYRHFGYSLPRTSAAQAAHTRSVSRGDVQVGDLFFYGSGSVSHVALYIGNGQIIHASNARDGIKISSAYYRQPLKIGRVM